MVWFRPSQNLKNSVEKNEKTPCSFSDETRRIGLEHFLKKLQSEYYKYHPYMIASKPGVTSSEVRKFYRPYDFRPEAMKKHWCSYYSLQWATNWHFSGHERKQTQPARKEGHVHRQTHFKGFFQMEPIWNKWLLWRLAAGTEHVLLATCVQFIKAS